MSEDIVIRRIGASELGIVKDLADRIWPHAFAGVIERHQIEIMLGDIYALEALEDEMASLGHVFWLARHAGQDAAFVSAFKRDDVTWINEALRAARTAGAGAGAPA